MNLDLGLLLHKAAGGIEYPANEEDWYLTALIEVGEIRRQGIQAVWDGDIYHYLGT